MTDLDRRTFLKTGAVAAGAATLGGPFAGYLAAPAVAGKGRHLSNELVPVADLRDGVERLALPEGFRYRSFQPSARAASGGPTVILDDGAQLPGRHDGMACFGPPEGYGLVTLVRNHEENGSAENGAPRGRRTPVYDSAALGGTSTVVVTPKGEVEHSFMSLGGTQMNCSGGRTPWNSWITCEETVNGYDVGDDFTRGTAGPLTYVNNARLQKTHGYIFEVPAEGRASARPIRHAGRFAHEAVAFDPRHGDLYLTEDNFGFPSGFYKYVPPGDPTRAGRIRDGGTLWMLKVKGVDQAELSLHQANGTTYDVEWVEIDEPWFDFGRPPAGATEALHTNDEAISFVSNQGLAKGAARFSRLEGAVFDQGWVFWTSTQGGATLAGEEAPSGYGDGFGQIWGYDIRARRLHMLYESPSREVLDFPDNVTMSRRNTLVVCEDGGEGNYLRGLTRGGRLFDIARNNLPEPDANDEFAGAAFTPGGRTLFVNIQDTVGLSFAIWGPWHRIDV